MREVVVTPRVISLFVCDRCRTRRWIAAGETVDAKTALRLAALHDLAVAGSTEPSIDLTEPKGA